LLPQVFRSLNVALLCFLVSASDEDDDVSAPLAKVDAEAGTNIDPEF